MQLQPELAVGRPAGRLTVDSFMYAAMANQSANSFRPYPEHLPNFLSIRNGVTTKPPET
jgi:hypothetical protein